MAGKKVITARVLATVFLEGFTYPPNDVIKAPEELLAPLIKDGVLDDNKAAVEYCTKELGREVIDHAGLVKAAEKEAEEAAADAADDDGGELAE